MVELPKRYRAKLINSDREVEGYYFQYPETTYCFTEDYARHPVKTIHCLVFHTMTDWGLRNEVKMAVIDPETLREVNTDGRI